MTQSEAGMISSEVKQVAWPGLQYYRLDEDGKAHLIWQNIAARLQSHIRDVENNPAWQLHPEPVTITYQLPPSLSRTNNTGTRTYHPGNFFIYYGAAYFDIINRRLEQNPDMELLAYYSCGRWHYPDGARRIEPPPFPGGKVTAEVM